jgi:redox-sensitive bicupin YhaK (pirin superfamily)
MRSIVKAVQATPVVLSQSSIRLRRVIGTIDMDGKGTEHGIAEIDPFIFLDEAGFEGQISSSFQKHPHTGLTAVTYLLEGTVHAWDNIHGATPELNHAGGVYCVNAGKGIVHGEAPIEGSRKVRLLQMWYNPGIYELPLPEASYQLFQPNELPIYEDEQIWLKVIIGEAFQLISPVLTRWPIQYLHIKLAPQQAYTFNIPNPKWQGFIYVLSGQGTFGSNKIAGNEGQCLVLGREKSLSIPISNSDSTPLVFILASGKAHGRPLIKLLGHGGAIVADTKAHARTWMQKYEKDPEHFGLD